MTSAFNLNSSTIGLLFQNDHFILLDHAPLGPNERELFFSNSLQLVLENGQILKIAELPLDTPRPTPETWLTLREAFSHLDPSWHGLVIKAYSLLRWNKHHRFCGCCGQHTQLASAGYERICASCQLNFYPRLSPSIIVRIVKDGQILLARGHHFKTGFFGLIAGFVEPGETLEEAIHREVKEETNLTIQNLHYFGSQPWPFPDSLMMAFTADYASGQLIIDPKEIAEANWFDAHHLPPRPKLKISIAQQLIDDYIKNYSPS